MVALIFGSKGTGKTTYMLKQIKTSVRPCIAIDTIQDTDIDYGTMRFDKYMIRISGAKGLPSWDKFKVVYTPDTTLDMNVFCYHLYQMCYNVDIFIDELDMWTSKQLIPDEIYNLFRYSRHRGFNIYATMRNPYEIHRNIRATADYYIIFRLQEKGHLDFFEYYKTGISDTIHNLALHEYLKLAAWG